MSASSSVSLQQHIHRLDGMRPPYSPHLSTCAAAASKRPSLPQSRGRRKHNAGNAQVTDEVQRATRLSAGQDGADKGSNGATAHTGWCRRRCWRRGTAARRASRGSAARRPAAAAAAAGRRRCRTPGAAAPPSAPRSAAAARAPCTAAAYVEGSGFKVLARHHINSASWQSLRVEVSSSVSAPGTSPAVVRCSSARGDLALRDMSSTAWRVHNALRARVSFQMSDRGVAELHRQSDRHAPVALAALLLQQSVLLLPLLLLSALALPQLLCIPARALDIVRALSSS